MNNAFFRRIAAQSTVAALFLIFSSQSSAQYVGTNGIFAEFNTSLGSYTCVLYYAQSPKAVAHFIGLATGQRAWLSLPTGVVKTNPFYAGIIHHRVINNFIIQAGSPNGVGTDGPGYVFVDEFTNTLRFDKFGVLAMANSGADANGSQFFITTTNTPGLNDVHTIFGQVYGGSNVVIAISRVATGPNPVTGANDKPLTNIVINSVKIQRIGAAATSFDIAAQGLPLVTNLNLKITKAGTNVSLTYSNRLYTDNRLYASADLTAWTVNQLGMDNSLPLVGTNLQSATAPAQFFRGVQIQYPSSTGPPRYWYGKTLTMFFTNGVIGTNVMVFNASGGGTYSYNNGAPGTILGYNWNQAPLPFKGDLTPIGYSGLNDTVVNLHWKTATRGKFNGIIYPFGYPLPFNLVFVSGTFTNSP